MRSNKILAGAFSVLDAPKPHPRPPTARKLNARDLEGPLDRSDVVRTWHAVATLKADDRFPRNFRSHRQHALVRSDQFPSSPTLPRRNCHLDASLVINDERGWDCRSPAFDQSTGCPFDPHQSPQRRLSARLLQNEDDCAWPSRPQRPGAHVLFGESMEEECVYRSGEFASSPELLVMFGTPDSLEGAGISLAGPNASHPQTRALAGEHYFLAAYRNDYKLLQLDT
jgi:hypothetical protein